MAKAKSFEDAKTSQKEAKQALTNAKKELKDYFSKNKLKKTKDYSEDKKHGKKIARLTTNIEKAEGVLAKANEAVKENKPATARATKYDYPADIDTPEKRKKYRQEMRAKANGKTKKEKPAKEEGGKTKKTKVKKTKEAAPAEETPKKVKKGKVKKVKKTKKNEDD